MSGLVADLRNIMYNSAVPTLPWEGETVRNVFAGRVTGGDLPFITGASAIRNQSQSSPIQDSQNFLLADPNDPAWRGLRQMYY